MSRVQQLTLPPPTPIALVLCDNVYRASNGKQALVGLFNQLFATAFPATHPRMCVFVSITSIRPSTDCSLDIVNAETDEAVVTILGPVPQGIPPTSVWDVVFELPPLTFPSAGRYYVRFLGNGQVLMQRPFEVIDLRQENAETDHANDEE